jgi:hypothetical protein
MADPVSSTSSQTPLTCLMPIKSQQDYEALAALLKVAKPQVDKALSAIGTVHFARFVFMQDNTQLAIITTYDGTFEQYISDFANYIGEIFDALFAHVSDPPPLPVKKNTPQFIKWVDAHNLPHSGFFSAYPLLNVVSILGSSPDAQAAQAPNASASVS